MSYILRCILLVFSNFCVYAMDVLYFEVTAFVVDIPNKHRLFTDIPIYDIIGCFRYHVVIKS